MISFSSDPFFQPQMTAYEVPHYASDSEDSSVLLPLLYLLGLGIIIIAVIRWIQNKGSVESPLPIAEDLNAGKTTNKI